MIGFEIIKLLLIRKCNVAYVQAFNTQLTIVIICSKLLQFFHHFSEFTLAIPSYEFSEFVEL